MNNYSLKLELKNQFFYYLFPPFIIGILLSTIIIIGSLVFFTNGDYDKKTASHIRELGKQNSILKINSINTLISTNLLKSQLSFNELIISYQKLANILNTNNSDLLKVINDDYLKCGLDLNYTLNETNEQANNMAYWLLDLERNLSSLEENSIEKNQLIILSNMMQNIYSVFYSHESISITLFFYFESTELFTLFPLRYDLETGFISEMTNFSKNNPIWCTDENGKIYNIYKVKCRSFYTNIKKSKTSTFDINYKDNENRTIFITGFYTQVSTEKKIVFSICIEFNDPFSNKPAYICSDINSNSLNYNLENYNNQLNGYFFVNSVGFSHSFYFPGNSDIALTAMENI